MIKRFNEEKPVEDYGYDVFNSNGDYIDFCVFDPNMQCWHCRYDEYEYNTSGTYYSDDHDDWLRMIEGLIELQHK